MIFPESWPECLRTVLLKKAGMPSHIALLAGGQSQATVWCVQASKQTLVVKRSMQPRESIFYTKVAPTGDPNPTNWGLRADGTIVLYDWERFGQATPAIDLAITVPGLGDRAVFQKVATTYLQLESSASSLLAHELPLLTQDIAAAKVWSVIEYLSLYHTGAIARSPRIDLLIQQIPAWVEEIITSKG